MRKSVIVIGRDYSVLDVNYAACTLFNLSKEEIIGKQCHELIHGLNKPCGPAMAICPFPRVFEHEEER